ncbi:MAG: DEAD/DEAH box helicase, partial [Caulobacteraceae bacterium]
DIEPLGQSLRELVPQLTMRIAHGQLPPEEVDDVMVRFAAGDGDVLLATNIIESGLDVPRANTMLVVRADLFGLAQLHQLRGRVGRGRTQGVAYLFHDADQDLPDATRARLSTLEAFDRLGSGLAISTRDLELRGAGDMMGDEQAGHVKLIGTALYQRLLTRAVRVVRGEVDGPDWTPELNIGLSGAFTETYVPDANTRINLYARLARMTEAEEIEAFADELEDRFGPRVSEVQTLLDVARLKALAHKARIVRIDAGPKAIALTPQGPADLAKLAKKSGVEATDQRLICRDPATEPQALVAQIEHLLAALAEPA